MEGLADAAATALLNSLNNRKYDKAEAFVTKAKVCILALNEYFSEVMRSRNPQLPVPDAVIAPFDNREFFPKEALPDFLACLATVSQALATAPILVETGQYRPRVQNRLYSDMAGEIQRDLANAVNYTAKVKLVSGEEYVIRTKPAPETLTGKALTERIQAIKKHMLALGVIRHYTEVEREARERQERLLGITDTPPPVTTNGNAPPPVNDPDKPLPPSSFSLD